MQDGIADLPAGQYAAHRYFSQEREIDCMIDREMQLPDSPAFCYVGESEIYNHIHAALEGIVNATAGVCGHNQNALKRLKTLQQEIGFEIGVAVVGGLHVRPAGEERISLVKKQDHIQFLRALENLVQALFCLTDIFIYHCREVEPVEVFLQHRSEQACRQCLTGSTWAAE